MRKLWFLGIGIMTLLGGCGRDESEQTLAAPLGQDATEASDEMQLVGNGAPSGAHFNLNLIGVPKNKSAGTGDGRRIFVRLEGNTKIMLSEGDFAVLDYNGTDGSAAFQLPAPDPDGDGVTAYKVYARALGKPGGTSRMTTCGTDVTTGEVVCSLETMVSVRNSGRSRFEDVSRQLLSMVADLDGDGTAERYPLFDSALQDMFWSYDNNGLRIVQLRFYSAE